jgi:hypothetical protein|tara:strand:- start:181 stop:504 length:324 start_codon:yes stop_codon:yes gene_type:complete
MFNLGRKARLTVANSAVNARTAVMQTKGAKKISIMVLSAWLKASRMRQGINPNKWDIPRVLAFMFDLALSPIEIFLIVPMQVCWDKFAKFIICKWEGTAKLKTLPSK